MDSKNILGVILTQFKLHYIMCIIMCIILLPDIDISGASVQKREMPHDLTFILLFDDYPTEVALTI